MAMPRERWGRSAILPARFSGPKVSPWTRKITCTLWMRCRGWCRFSIAKAACCISLEREAWDSASFSCQRVCSSTTTTMCSWWILLTGACRSFVITDCRSRCGEQGSEEPCDDLRFAFRRGGRSPGAGGCAGYSQPGTRGAVAGYRGLAGLPVLPRAALRHRPAKHGHAAVEPEALDRIELHSLYQPDVSEPGTGACPGHGQQSLPQLSRWHSGTWNECALHRSPDEWHNEQPGFIHRHAARHTSL